MGRGGWVVGGALLLVAGTLLGRALLGQSEPASPGTPGSAAAPPRVIAHRGGMGQWPENTLLAFRRAIAGGADGLDMDVRMSADGVPVVIHDAAVDRTTGGTGRVDALSLDALRALDAGHRWTGDGGLSHPYRGKGLAIPTLEEVLRALPGVRMGLEIKPDDPSLPARVCASIRDTGMQERVLVASFHGRAVRAFRTACPEVATSATFTEAARFYVRRLLGLEGERSSARAFQVPLRLGFLAIPTRGFVQGARRLDVPVEAWVANELDEMKALLRAGVDGIITDYPERLLALLRARRSAGSRRTATRGTRRPRVWRPSPSRRP